MNTRASNQGAAANGLRAVRSSVAGDRERTVRSPAAAELGRNARIMNLSLLLSLGTLVCASACVGENLPSIASLKPGEKVYVSMRLNGYTITGADFLFTPEKVTIKPLNKVPGDLILTKEEKTKLDEYFSMIKNGEKRTPDQEGFEYSIKLFRNEQQIGTWSFQIHDARESGKPNLSLYELKDRVEKHLKEAEKASAGSASRPKSDSEGGDKPQPEPKAAPR